KERSRRRRRSGLEGTSGELSQRAGPTISRPMQKRRVLPASRAYTKRCCVLRSVRPGHRRSCAVLSITRSGLFSVVASSLALYFAARRDDWVNALIATVLFALAILFMHFTGMGAVLLPP